VEMIIRVFQESVTPNIIKASFKHAGIYPFDYARAAQSIDGTGDCDPIHRVPDVLLPADVNSIDIFGRTPDAVPTLQQFTLMNAGYYITSSEKTSFNHDGSPSKRVKVTVSANVAPEILSVMNEIKKFITRDSKKRKEAAVPCLPYFGKTSCEPDFFLVNFQQRRDQVMKNIAWKKLQPILVNITADESFPDFKNFLDLNDADFKKKLLADKKKVIVPLITEEMFEKYFEVHDVPAELNGEEDDEEE